MPYVGEAKRETVGNNILLATQICGTAGVAL